MEQESRYVAPGMRRRGRPWNPDRWTAALLAQLVSGRASAGSPAIPERPSDDETARALAGIPAAEPVVSVRHRTRLYCAHVVGAYVASPYVLPPTPVSVRVGTQAVYGVRYARITAPGSALFAEVRWDASGVVETAIRLRGHYDRRRWCRDFPKLERALADFLGQRG